MVSFIEINWLNLGEVTPLAVIAALISWVLPLCRGEFGLDDEEGLM